MSVRVSNVKSSEFINKEVVLRGWVYRLRKQKEKTFILIRDDRGSVIQCVAPTSISSSLTIESSLQLKGIIKKDSRAPEGGYEVNVNEIKIFNVADSDYPIGEYQSDELLLDKRHLALRTRKMISLAKIRATILKFSRQWFIENDWLEVTAPTIVKGAVEGGSTLFKIKYFDETAYLSQSAQLYLEAMVFSLGPVWSLSPSFRAEKSRTVRHLAEFTHLEAEAPWMNLDEILSVQERLVFYVIDNILKETIEELEYLKVDIKKLKSVKFPFERISYSKAIEKLQSAGFIVAENDNNNRKRVIEFGDDLNIESERELTRNSLQPLFITGYPVSIKPFYVKEDPDNEKISLAADLLAPSGFGEITSGGLREDNLKRLENRIKNEGLDSRSYDWYLDLRKYGSVPHGGFGLGIERLVRWIANLEDIKDAVLFPRTMSRVSP